MQAAAFVALSSKNGFRRSNLMVYFGDKVLLTLASVAGLFTVKLFQHVSKVGILTELTAPGTAVIMGINTSLGWKVRRNEKENVY